ncbi:nagb/rpia/CoA transferase-like protein [Pseudovirgaria hyperparasitica]|uniref:Translation initiation factor eIF2B subunit beta n=1 Tax=Pseudovirgaria hyperparasitica TaxID=470096 RepID=A0A6A6WCG2_9PEZI|nr:nagb/rpia/CoA transferase-like protein [Pseudovirgaria hyperparasitica]KAF2759650.1 nagb/rpia/CoA transferase-like protein [Pseudovirgaria hyperparasitica]
MSTPTTSITPGLTSFLKSLKTKPAEPAIELLISLLKRRQIRNSRPCAIATTELLLRVVGQYNGSDADGLLRRVREVGQRLINAQPREMVVGNIVRRVLGLVREVAKDNADDVSNTTPSGALSPQQEQDGLSHPQRPPLPSTISAFSPLKHGATQPVDIPMSENLSDSIELPSRPQLISSATSYAQGTMPMGNSLFGIFQQSDTPSPSMTPLATTGTITPRVPTAQDFTVGTNRSGGKINLKAEVIEGINELADELQQADDQIAGFAMDHIHANEMILIHSVSTTVQKFLLTVARKRKFTVIVAEGSPNDAEETHDTVLNGRRKVTDELEGEDRFKPLHAAGIETVVISDSQISAIMPRINTVILATHAVLANGALLAASGASIIATLAKAHRTPVYVLSPVYKLSPVYPFNDEELIEYGDPGNVVDFSDGYAVEHFEVMNPLYDYVPADLVTLYITNIGGHAPTYLYRIVADHYYKEDVQF